MSQHIDIDYDQLTERKCATMPEPYESNRSNSAIFALGKEQIFFFNARNYISSPYSAQGIRVLQLLQSPSHSSVHVVEALEISTSFFQDILACIIRGLLLTDRLSTFSFALVTNNVFPTSHFMITWCIYMYLVVKTCLTSYYMSLSSSRYVITS